jgi:uncharacterized protein
MDQSEIDLDRLDAFLSSDESPEDCMLISDLDGFLHGVACSPLMIPAEEWMPVALGADPEDVPLWVLEAIGSLYMSIGEALKTFPPQIEPVFWETAEGHVIAMDWCEGFMEAVKLRAEPWEAFMKTEEGAELMMPILVHMIDENGNSMFGISQEEIDMVLDDAADVIPILVPAIYRLLSPPTVH